MSPSTTAADAHLSSFVTPPTSTSDIPSNQQATLGSRIYLVADGLSKHTKVNYLNALKHFFSDGAKILDLQVLLDYKPKIIEQMVIGYIENLRDKGRSHRTIQLHCAAIFHFFEINDIVLNKRKITRFIPPNESAGDTDGIYTTEEIHRITNEGCNDLRSKLMVMLMTSTGMRLGALPGLLVGHLQPLTLETDSQLKTTTKIYMVQVYAGTKGRYYTFTTPECTTAFIDPYLDYRRRLGEEITDKSPLIREMFDSHNPFIINAPKRLTERMIQVALEQALKRAGINQRTPSLDKAKRRQIMRSHGYRKWAITQMIKARVDYSVREFLVGHKASRGLDFNYDRTSVEDRLREWSKAIPLLTIDPTYRLQNKVQQLESERITKQDLDVLRTQWMRELQKERAVISLAEWNTLKEQMKNLKKGMMYNAAWARKNMTKEEYIELFMERRADRERYNKEKAFNFPDQSR